MFLSRTNWTQKQDEALVSLWLEGGNSHSIAPQIGRTQLAVLVRMTALRRKGYDLPYRPTHGSKACAHEPVPDATGPRPGVNQRCMSCSAMWRAPTRFTLRCDACAARRLAA